MAEAFSWTEGNVYFYTGSLAASALVAYAEKTNVTLNRGWDNRAHASGGYNDHLTGYRADVSIGAVYTVDKTLLQMFESATATHMKFIHGNVIGSGGIWLYSGRIDNYSLDGSPGKAFMSNIRAHFNVWSAF